MFGMLFLDIRSYVHLGLYQYTRSDHDVTATGVNPLLNYKYVIVCILFLYDNK